MARLNWLELRFRIRWLPLYVWNGLVNLCSRLINEISRSSQYGVHIPFPVTSSRRYLSTSSMFLFPAVTKDSLRMTKFEGVCFDNVSCRRLRNTDTSMYYSVTVQVVEQYSFAVNRSSTL
ncbi:hypothetical protein P691DRAFT_596613 [Macrolepiota fuliginosa MF-IS2]|uniref:Uncharacterized protein n=1 Tax=Macrolepiota fuliginosa MF-IS2 TaxID=1400762 RepID=A0A9P5WZ38_9AGAR|nr:hypothetical protein P691DRAFT_596613 [Macrolepiota fuliginosa MF-IS2]